MTVDVELVVAVHSASRPVERAVTSILACPRAGAIVVVHNTDPEPIRTRLGALMQDPRLKLLELHDGVHSPAGPFNHGLDAAAAPFVGKVDSDDELAPDAVEGWLALQERWDADVVIAREQDASTGAFSPTPPVRVPLHDTLDGGRDRLSYRVAVRGIHRRERFPRLRFTPGLVSGEDIAFATELWFTPCVRVFDAHGAPYRVYADAVDRVTADVRDLADDFAFLDVQETCMRRLRLTRGQVRGIVLKTVRIHVFSALENRPRGWWSAARRAELADIVRRVVGVMPDAVRQLSVTDRTLLDAMVAPDAPTGGLYDLIAQRRNRRALRNVFTRSPLAALRREAPLRLAVASYLRVHGTRR